MTTAAELVRRVREAYASDEGQRTGTTYTAPHAAAGSPTGGQFTSTNGSGSKKKKPPAKKKPVQSAAAPAAPKPSPALAYATQSYQDFGSISHRTAAGDPRITAVQTLMRSLGMPVPASGKFDPEMQAQVKAMQLKLGMSPTGRVTGSLMKTLQKAAILSPCAKESVTFSAADLVRRVREGWEDQRRAPQGTGIGGRWVRMGAVVAALRGAGHPEAAKALRANPPKASRRGSSRWSPSDREVRGHARAVAERNQLREQIARRDEDLAAPQFEGGRMSNPAERRKAEKERDEYRRQLAEIEPRVAAGERNRALNPEAYADPLPGGADPVAAARVRIAEIEGRRDAAGTPIMRPGWTMDLGSLTSDEQMQLYQDRQLVAQADASLPGGDGPAAYEDPLPGGDGFMSVAPGARADLTGASGLSSDPVVRQVQLANSAREAYRDLPKAPAGWVGLADLREHPSMRGLSREDQDAALLGVMKEGQRDNSARFTPIANRRTLTARDHAAALDYGDPRHMVSLDDPSPRPLPDGDGPAAPSTAEPLSTDPATRAVQVDNRVRAAYAAVQARSPGSDWVGLADLRNELGEGTNRHEVDDALRRLEQTDGVNIVPESNQKTLRPEDRVAAVTIGDQQKHAITMDDPSSRPLPDSGGAPAAPADRELEVAQARVDALNASLRSAKQNRRSLDVDVQARRTQRIRDIQEELDGAQRHLGQVERDREQSNGRQAELGDAAAKAAPLSALDAQGRVVPLPSKEERDRAILGDKEYERRQGAAKPAKKTAAAKVKAAKVAVDHSDIVSRVQAAGSEDEVRAMLEGLTLKDLKIVADRTTLSATVGGVGARGTKQQIIDRIAAAPSAPDHAARVMEFQDGDSVVRYLAESKLTIPQLKALGNELGGSLVNMRGSKQQLMERIGAHVGDRHRPIMGFASVWARGTPTPVAPSAPVELSDAEKARRAEILSRPLAQPRAMRPEDGAGVFSADPEIQARAARILDEQTDARRALQAAMESPPKESAAAKVRAAKAVQVPVDEMSERDLLAEDAKIKTPRSARQKAVRAEADAIRANKAAPGAAAPSAPAPVARAAAPSGQQFDVFGTPITRYRNDGATPLFGSEPTGDALEPQRRAEIESAVQRAYDQLARRPGSMVALADLRERLGDRFSREEVDNALVLMNRGRAANVVPESDQLSLTPRDHSAGIIIGNQDKHRIVIQSRDVRSSGSASPTPSAPAPRTAAEKVAAARAQPYSAANMTTVGSDPGDVAARIDRARDAAAIDAEMTGMTVADLRKVARELSMPLPAAPSGKWTPESLREYIAMIHLRERGRWNLR